MAGVYIHIPFCRQSCHYCNFHFSTNLRQKELFVSSLLKEIELRKTYLHENISTIYFGGGTPSILPSLQIEEIISNIKDTFIVDKDAEITLEANPDDITAEKLQEWKKIGINRLSIGIQSFFEEDLKWMNRAHNAQQAKDCLVLARSFGYDNFTIDLIYGTATLTDENWKKNVTTAIALKVPHLSCYALTVEPKTALSRLIEKKMLKDVNQETQARHFEMLMEWMATAGYEHYEISNFAIPGYRSKHNSSYWQSKYYLGLGPSAHSYNGHSRQWNVSNNALYIQSLQKNIVPFEEEILTTAQKINEYLMTSLRTLEGISLEILRDHFGENALIITLKNAQPHIDRNNLVEEEGFLKTTLTGKLLADGIASDLFVV